jgi:hypothetical protein
MKKCVAISLIALMLSVSLASPANAAKCSKADQRSYDRISAEMASLAFTGDLTGVFGALRKAKRSTKSSAMKSFYTKFENTLERDNGIVSRGTDSQKIFYNFFTKIKYNRC